MSTSALGLHIGAAVLGYLIGSFPTGVVLSKRKYRIDVREMGSGNIGATNMARVYGWYAGLITLSIDFLKGFLPLLYLKTNYSSYPWLITIAGASLVLGHCFSLFLSFRGGKGVATSFGCVVAVLPEAALVSLAFYLLLIWRTKIGAVGSLGGIIVTFIYTMVVQPVRPITVLILIVCATVLIRHHSNIRRLLADFVKKK